MELHQRQKEGNQQCGCRWMMSDQVESCLGLLWVPSVLISFAEGSRG